MRYAQYCMPIFFIILSIIYFIFSIKIPGASLGDPNEPRYFPLLVSVFMILVSIVYFINVWRKGEKENPEIKLMLSKRVLFLSVSTIILGLVYGLVFLKLGFIVSTLIFLGGLLFVVNGKKWKVNIIVTVSFTFIFWYIFEKLLTINLP